MKKNIYVILVLLILGVLWLNNDIEQKKKDEANKNTIAISADPSLLSDDDPNYERWGKVFPEQLDMYLKVEKEKPQATEFGSNLAYSKLIRFPQLTILWAGYPFSIDANEERGHFWVQIDQMKTARNNKDFLNAHGFKAFKGQPTACMNCHSGWTPWLIKNVAKEDFVAFNSTNYWTMMKNIPAANGIIENSPQHAGAHGGKRMGVTCADCHMPYIREGAKKISQHNITSSLRDINSACKACHKQSENELRDQVKDIQNIVASEQRAAEYALVSFIMDIKKLREKLGTMEQFQIDNKPDETKISTELKDILELHRKSQMRVDFVNAENSTGFHNPREASRIIFQAIDMARMGQAKLLEIANANNIKDFQISNLGFEDIQKLNPGELYYKVDVNAHKAGERYYENEKDVNINPPEELLKEDKNLSPYNYKFIDKK